MASDVSLYLSILLYKMDELFAAESRDSLETKGLRVEPERGKAEFLVLASVPGLVLQDGLANLPLSTPLAGITGQVQVTLSERHKTIFSASFCTLPQLRYSFDRVLYSSVQGGSVSWAGEGYDRFPEGGTLEFSAETERVFCLLTVKGGATFELAFEAPRIKWRAGKGWETTPREIWHEDLGELEVMVPPGFAGKAKLVLNYGDRVQVKSVRDRAISFDLRRFADACRGSEQSVHWVHLDLAKENAYVFSMQPLANCGLNRLLPLVAVSDVRLSIERD